MLGMMGLVSLDLERVLLALGAMVVFGVVGIGLMALGYKVFDWITPRLDLEKELGERHNVAVAIVMAAVLLGVAAVAVMAMV